MKKLISLLMALVLTLSLCPVWAEETTSIIGTKLEDVTVLTSEGETLSILSLLDEYDMVLVNFFFDGCVWCEYEFPHLQAAYEKYQDRVAVVALSPYDSNESIATFKKERGLTFIMASVVDQMDWVMSLGVSSFPTSFVMDRAGILCCELSTELFDKCFEDVFEAFTGEDYIPSNLDYVPRPVTVADVNMDAGLTDAFYRAELQSDGATEYLYAMEDGYIFPLYVLASPESEATLLLRLSSQVDLSQSYIFTNDRYLLMGLAEADPEEKAYRVNIPAGSVGDGYMMVLVYTTVTGEQDGAFLAYVVSSEETRLAMEETEGLQRVEEETPVQPSEITLSLNFRDTEGGPVAGVMATVCDEGSCTMVISDTEGLGTFTGAPGAYEIHVLSVPEGYTLPGESTIPVAPTESTIDILFEKR